MYSSFLPVSEETPVGNWRERSKPPGSPGLRACLTPPCRAPGLGWQLSPSRPPGLPRFTAYLVRVGVASSRVGALWAPLTIWP